MNEITTVRTADVIAAEINGIKAQTRTVLLCGSIEIGRRLVEAKGMVDHGQWGDWLEKSVDYSKSTANNLMRIFEEYGADQITLFGDNSKSQTFGNLNYSQAVALLGVPEGEREAFAQENDVANMSARELQEAVKARKEAEDRAAAAEKNADEADKSRETIKYAYEKLSSQTADLQNRLILRENKIKNLTDQLEEARNNGSSSARVAALEQQLTAAQEQVVTLTEELNKPVTVEATVIETSAAVQKYGIYFEQLVSGFKSLLGALAEIQETDPAAHEKYKGAVSGLLGKMSERL
ncbi:MAG: DUF3102 domain-containing protein [Negativicutes bacterium]|nr:DUF3102 domain-containing protein [Negativicutes bacterium]